MKKAGLLSALLLAPLLCPGGLRATTPNDTATQNPYADLDPDGVPLGVTQEQKNTLAPDQIEALRRQALQEARDRNWLMIEYAHQLNLHAKDSSGQPKPANIYLQLSMDKDLAKLAGLDFAEAPARNEPPPELHANTAPSTKAASGLRPEAPSPTSAFTPLITPLSPLSPSAIQPFSISTYSSAMPSILSPSTGMPRPDSSPAPAAPAHSTAYTEISDLQTPGMVAAKNDSIGDVGTPDLSLDSLLPQSGTQGNVHDQAALPAALPQVMDAGVMHRAEAVKLAVPTAPGAVKPSQTPTQTAQVTPPVPVNPADAPVPVTQQQPITPVHPFTPNPYDIFNH